jgi:hypothetical protein
MIWAELPDVMEPDSNSEAVLSRKRERKGTVTADDLADIPVTVLQIVQLWAPSRDDLHLFFQTSADDHNCTLLFLPDAPQ